MDALYCLHPRPHLAMEAVLKQAAAHAGGGSPETTHPAAAGANNTGAGPETTAASPLVSASRLSRFVFLVGHCALSHLALVDGLAKRVRRERMLIGGGSGDGDGKKAEDGKAAAAGEEGGDIAAQIGMGAQAAVGYLVPGGGGGRGAGQALLPRQVEGKGASFDKPCTSVGVPNIKASYGSPTLLPRNTDSSSSPPEGRPSPLTTTTDTPSPSCPPCRMPIPPTTTKTHPPLSLLQDAQLDALKEGIEREIMSGAGA